MTMRMTDRMEVTNNRGCVRLIVGDMPDPLVVVMSGARARMLAQELNDEAGVADLDNEETASEMAADATDASPASVHEKGEE